jgi:hypothetical protein
MNNSNTDTLPAITENRTKTANSTDELTRLKRELLQAEVRLAKARATMVTAEIDIKVLNTRLKELTRG